MQQTIKYICYYNRHNSLIKRNCAPSAVNKIDYIVSALADADYHVELVSVSQVLEPPFRYYKEELDAVNNKITIRYFSSFGGNSRLAKVLKNIFQYINLLLFLLFKTKKNETVIAYHSLGYRYAFIAARYIKRFKLIYEVEELYSDVINAKWCSSKGRELRMIAHADAYIFPTEMLNKKFNTKEKPHVIIYGSYRYAESVRAKYNDGKIHVLYAGTFDLRKGGAAAAAAAAFLPENYHMHICGFGNESDTKQIRQIIDETAKVSKAKITFEGLKLGQEYVDFVQQCHIGLSTQEPEASFNNTSFPSKILSYMSNGCSVVSIDILAIKESKLSEHIVFYKQQDAESIAKAIMKTNLQNDNIDVVRRLDESFKTDLVNMFNRI